MKNHILVTIGSILVPYLLIAFPSLHWSIYDMTQQERSGLIWTVMTFLVGFNAILKLKS